MIQIQPVENNPKKLITLRTDFASGGLLDVGYRAAGITPVYAVEMSETKCEAYRLNVGDHIVLAQVEDVDPMRMPGRVDVYHVSPSCKKFSKANSKGGETALDISAAQAIVRNLNVLKPAVFTLENVRQYEASKSFGLIKAALQKLGYRIQHHVVCAADYGVPQTRNRLFLVATRADMPLFEWPEPTHHDGSFSERRTLFDTLLDDQTPATDDIENTTNSNSFIKVEVRRPWRGWYEAIEDLLPTLEEDSFAQWQLERLPAELKTFLATVQGANSDYLEVQDPAPTITSAHNATKYRALLLDSKNAGQEWGNGYREDTLPCYTVTNLARPSHLPRAFVVEGSCGGRAISSDGSGGVVVVSSSNSFTLPVRGANEPIFTIKASADKTVTRAMLAQGQGAQRGRVVRMSVRALARFQSVPDDYQFSGKLVQDCSVIGDGIPCLLAEMFGRQIVKLFTGK